MANLIIAKFGGSVIGPDGLSIPSVIRRIADMNLNAKVLAVFSAPLTMIDGKKTSLTDVVLEQGKITVSGTRASLETIRLCYDRILGMVDAANIKDCRETVELYLKKAQDALDYSLEKREFTNEVRSTALAFSGELLMSRVMDYILKSNNMKSSFVSFDDWPIITDHNIESANFLVTESKSRLAMTAKAVKENDVVTIGGFIGKTAEGIITTYERGGSDRTAADLGILFHRLYDARIDFEKDSAVVSADPKIVNSDLSEVSQLSYNEARLAGMFGMKILDPIAIKEMLEHGVDMPIIITNMNDPAKITTIKRTPDNTQGHPIKIVTGTENCAIFRIETSKAQNLLESMKKIKRYGEFVILSPFTKDGIEFSRILFLDGDYVKRNEKYLLAFDPLAAITYNRGAVTLIGDEMWKVQHVASQTSARIGQAGLNILNMDAQEETSRILIIVEDSDDNIKKAIGAIHRAKSEIGFVK